ncbi:MAG: FGGY family carbohydrate kinase [Armatimonadota bacterium]
MDKDIAVVFDCGSTNITVIAIDASGEILTSWSVPNEPVSPEDEPDDHLVWDVDGLWDKLSTACSHCVEDIDPGRITAVTVTTWGADGTFIDEDGDFLYPAISWQDGRTEALADQIAADLDPWEIYQTSGYTIIPFNTLLKLRWLVDNEPEIVEKADHFLMMPGIFSYLLCGERSLDPTSAGTTMAIDMAARDWSEELLSWAGVSDDIFPPLVEPGRIIGRVTRSAAAATGLPEDTPVVAAGHDTQFAAVGSGAGPTEAILSSGTWEILMLRSTQFNPAREDFENGLLIEADAEAGKYNPQFLMMGSGVLEWLRDQFYTDMAGAEVGYGDMIVAAEGVEPGADGLTVIPSFVADTGPLSKYDTEGTIVGLKLSSSRDHLYRAALEGLSFQLRQAVDILTANRKVGCTGIRAVGGGSKNDLWNQIRADVCQMPVTTIEQKEATVLGAAMFAFVGGEVYDNIQQAQQEMISQTFVFEPGENAAKYQELFEDYTKIPPALADHYGS